MVISSISFLSSRGSLAQVHHAAHPAWFRQRVVHFTLNKQDGWGLLAPPSLNQSHHMPFLPCFRDCLDLTSRNRPRAPGAVERTVSLTGPRSHWRGRRGSGDGRIVVYCSRYRQPSGLRGIGGRGGIVDALCRDTLRSPLMYPTRSHTS